MDETREQSPKSLEGRAIRVSPWLFQASSPSLAMLLIVSALCASHVALFLAGPLAALLASVLAITIYIKYRYGGGIFGPLWLELIDIAVLLGNAGIFLTSCIILIWRWLT
jgi:hypothetical protein